MAGFDVGKRRNSVEAHDKDNTLVVRATYQEDGPLVGVSITPTQENELTASMFGDQIQSLLRGTRKLALETLEAAPAVAPEVSATPEEE